MTNSHVALLLLGCIYQPVLFSQNQRPDALDVFLVVDNSGSMRPNDPSFSMPAALSAFAGRLPPNSQLGILIFDKEVKVVLELTRTASGQFQSDVGNALRKLNYKGSRSDLAGAVERAIYELRQQGLSDGRRAIVLVTDGVLDLGSRSATATRTRWLREDLAAEAKSLDIRLFAVTLSQAADYQLIQTLASTTGGEYYRALRPPLLPFALAQVTERLSKIVENAEVTPANPVNLSSRGGPGVLTRLLMLGLVAALVLAGVLVIVLTKKRPELKDLLGPAVQTIAVQEVTPTPSLSALREHGTAVSRELANATDLLTQTNSRVNHFQTAVERYALSNYKVLQDADEQCLTLARECILLLDHLDLMLLRADQKGEPVTSLRDARRRLCSLLETAGIEEIPVTAGDVFDSAVQIVTSTVGLSGPEGVVVEVSRKGYAMKVSGRDDVMIRAAEVTVSTRPAEATFESKGHL